MSKAKAVFAKHFPSGPEHPLYWKKIFVEMGRNRKYDPTTQKRFSADTPVLSSSRQDWDWRELSNAAYRFEQIAFEQMPVVYKRKADIDALDQLSKAISKIERLLKGGALSYSARRRMSQRIIYGPHTNNMPCDNQEDLRNYMLENGIIDGSDPGGEGSLIDYMEKRGYPQNAAIEALLKYAPELKKAIANTKKDILASPRTRKSPSQINLGGVQCVEAARNAWEENTGKKPPSKDLNAGSAFGKFLADLFDAYEIEGEPKSAFRAWARLMKGTTS